ncbi:hypothetical protein Ddye_009814 [Dipteronia dyeriana]|uniref:ERCC1-like central domain-containing protein n=1 Tax=Dipteronia dyeriana TaxID=168575 RepID=A0AAD9XCI5_9ROSI|nr:hypothetical protein Ddye_009814 [Dipteronia dyeriana]
MYFELHLFRSFSVVQSGASNVVVASTSSQPQSNHSRNSILVSHRQSSVSSATSGLPLLPYKRIAKNFKLHVVLYHIDVDDVVKLLLEVTKTAMLHDCTLLCAWSLEECGRYLETIKVYENKPAYLIHGQMDTDYLSRLTDSLTSMLTRQMWLPLALHLGYAFLLYLPSCTCLVDKCSTVTDWHLQSLSHIMDASMEDLARCPGIGERKVKRLHGTFHEPFKRVVSSHPPVPETPVQKDAEPCLETEEATGVEKDTGDTSKKGRMKESELTVKSILSAAFAKYADTIGKKSNSPGKKRGETSATKSGDEDGSIGEGATS